MFLFDNRFSDRQSETGAFTDRFCREERRIEFLFCLFRNSLSVVFYAQVYTVTLFFQAYPDGWLIGRIGYLFRLAEYGVAGIVHQVEYGAAEILRNNFY